MNKQMVVAVESPAGRVLPAGPLREIDWASVLDCGALGPRALGPSAPGPGRDEPALFYQRGEDQAGGQDA